MILLGVKGLAGVVGNGGAVLNYELAVGNGGVKYGPSAGEEDERVVIGDSAGIEVERNIGLAGILVDEVLTLSNADCEGVEGYVVVNCIGTGDKTVVANYGDAGVMSLLDGGACGGSVMSADNT